MKKGNLKDTVTTICGILLAASGIILTLATGGLALPVAVVTTATATGAISGGIIAFLTGKNPDGSTKTQEQVQDANNGK